MVQGKGESANSDFAFLCQRPLPILLPALGVGHPQECRGGVRKCHSHVFLGVLDAGQALPYFLGSNED